MKEDLQCRAKAARRAGSGRIIRIDAELSDDHVSVVAHALLQALQDLRCAALLLSESKCRAVFAAERICDVAHNCKVCFSGSFIES